MSQVAAKKKIILRNERVKVIAHFAESGSVLGGTQRGVCRGFSIELSLESEIPTEEIATLIRLSHQMCFTEAALSSPVPLTMSHIVNGQMIQLS